MIVKFVKGINYLFGKLLLSKKINLTSSLTYLNRKRHIDVNYFDYVRLASLELISYEIEKRGITGAVAEVGVYKGKFARYINQYFPYRTLYLFDTFEGFDKRDINSEVQNKFSDGKQDFSSTSITAVQSIMPIPEKCIFKKGYFPETAAGINESFVFVSLDTDLYQPIYSGLVYFYPKLSKGGYIFIHDFNNENYLGAREAVTKFCAENDISYTPIPDSGGSAIICK